MCHQLLWLFDFFTSNFCPWFFRFLVCHFFIQIWKSIYFWFKNWKLDRERSVPHMFIQWLMQKQSTPPHPHHHGKCVMLSPSLDRTALYHRILLPIPTPTTFHPSSIIRAPRFVTVKRKQMAHSTTNATQWYLLMETSQICWPSVQINLVVSVHCFHQCSDYKYLRIQQISAWTRACVVVTVVPTTASTCRAFTATDFLPCISGGERLRTTLRARAGIELD